ncbi:ATP-binding cassette sub-family D member 3 [Smittium mucronatum]|uniref:ATP-binding cassette sub-family D member 3 n=1 Tax=Smittium mucronatum TaxID=133383 RepID=A0A1R0GUD5_9FUNG|nr:ATP-binding cassette sub-family D member 3 [Smittium mucronatum]
MGLTKNPNFHIVTNTSLLVAVGFGSSIFFSSYCQHRDLMKRVKNLLNVPGVAFFSTNIGSAKNSIKKQSSLDISKTALDCDSIYFLQGPRNSVQEDSFRYLPDILKNPFRKIVSFSDPEISNKVLPDGDLTKFCSSLSLLLSSLVNPAIDLMAFGIQLNRNLGANGSSVIALFYTASFLILKKITPSFEKFIASGDQFEENLRLDYSNTISNSEEIAMLRGEKYEKRSFSQALYKLINFCQSIIKKRFKYVIAEDMIVKYIWSALGYLIGAYPYYKDVYNLGVDLSSSAIRMRKFVSNRWLMVYIIDAAGRLVFAPKRLMELSGSTDRIFSFVQTCHTLRKDYYPDTSKSSASSSTTFKEFTLAGARRAVYQDFNGIKLTCVPIVLPNLNPYSPGKVLIQPLIWTVNPGENWLVKGPVGVGKSSMLKIISGLWPTFTGILEKPSNDDIMYISSRSYMCMGSLRDQITYPHDQSLMIENGYTDDDLLEILKIVSLDYLLDREGGLDSVKNLTNSLTDEESQKICMARLFYHHPKFAILDECTSVISYAVEEKIYRHAKSINITLITISNRSYLALYHDFVLRFDDTYIYPIPTSSLRRGNNSPKLNNRRPNLSSSNNIVYTGPSCSGAELVEVDEGDEIIRSNLSENALRSQPSSNLGVSWHIARLKTVYSVTQNVSLSHDSPIEKYLDGYSTCNEQSPTISHDSSTSYLSDPSTAKIENADNNRTEIFRMRRILSERRQMYQACEARLSDINLELTKVVLDRRILDSLK